MQTDVIRGWMIWVVKLHTDAYVKNIKRFHKVVYLILCISIKVSDMT